MIKKLEKVKKRINIYDYSLKDLAYKILKYHKSYIVLETNTKKIIVNIYKYVFPHLIGMQYAYKNISEFKGNQALNKIINNYIKIKDIKRNT